MRNLKRALSLLLAAAMLIGMMVVGASAAGSLDDFSDKDEIVNQDAVSLLTILGVIEGKEDGSYFDPTGNVTRAEMAKMIATILNQGADVDGLYTGMNTGLTDVAGHWAESYINYCYSLGIIAGRGDGTFDPGATVTGTEAAKMLLVAAGYDASIEGLTGNDWAIRTAALASTLGIFDNLNAPTGAPLTRDNAALLVYNALDIEMIQSYQNGYAIAYSDNRTLLSTKYGVYRIEGTVVGNEWAQLEETDSDAAMAEGKTRLTDVKLIDSDTVNTRPGVDDGQSRPDTTFNVSTPVDYLGQTVTMYVRNTTVLANSEVLGVYLKDGANVIYNSADTEDTMKDFLKGTGLSTDADTEYYVNYGYMASQGAATAAMDFEMATGRFASVNGKTNAYGVEMTVIDNNQDGIVDYVLWLQESLSQVTAKNTSKETTTLVGFNNNKAIDDEDIVAEDEVSEGDLALVVSYGGRYYVSAPEVVAGEMESFQASKTKEQTIKVSGTDYHPSYIQYEAITADNTYEFNIAQCDTDDGVQFDTTYDFILDSNGNVIAYRPSEQGLYDYALVLESGYEPGAFASDASGKVTVLLPDGTEGTYTLNFSASAKNIGEQIAEINGNKSDYTKNQGIQELKGFLGTADSDLSSTAPWAADVNSDVADVFIGRAQSNYKDGRAVGYVIGYSLNDNNILTITSIVGANTDDSTAAVNEYSNATDNALSSAYSTGAARIRYNGDRDQVTIDKNTVAFYFVDENNNGEADSGEYGVAVGYDEMSDVAARTPFVANKVRNTNLAAVVLFNAKGTLAEKDYVYVLSKNTVGSSQAILNVVYMDGTVGEMTIDRDNYDDVFDSDAKFGTAYAYKADGDIYEIDETNLTVKTGYALKLRNGSMALYNDKALKDFEDSYSYDAQIWNVENVDAGDDKAPATDFANLVGKEVVLVLDAAGDKVRAAFVESTLTDEADPGYVGDLELDDPYVTGNILWTASDIETELKKGNSVLINDDWAPASADTGLTIPSGLGVQIAGDMNMTGKTLNNQGKLIVDGKLTAPSAATLTGTIKADSMAVSGATTVDGTVNVVNDLDVSGTLTINVGDTLNVDGNITGSGSIVNNGTLNVKGDVASSVTVDKGGKATISGDLNNAVTLTDGTVSVTGSVNGNVTQTKGTLSVGGDLVTTSSNAIVVDTNNALTVTGTLNNKGGTVTVNNGKTLSVGALGTRGTPAGNVTVTDGTLTVSNAAYTGTVTVTKGSMTTGDLNSGAVTQGTDVSSNATAGDLTVKGTLTVSGAVAVNNGTLTVDEDVDNNASNIVVGGTHTSGKLVVDGAITGTGSLEVKKGSAEVGGVVTVANVAASQSLTVNGDVGTITTNNGTIVVNGDVTTAISDIAGGDVTVNGNVKDLVAMTGGTLTVDDIETAVDASLSGVLNLNGAATITASGAAATYAEINVGSTGVLTIDGKASQTITVTAMTGTGNAQAVINWTASDGNITLPSGLFVNGGTPITSAISDNTNNGTYTFDGTHFAK